MSSAWQGHPVVRSKPLFWEYGRNEKFFAYPQGRDRSPNLAIREESWKLLINANGSRAELYDITVDPKETNNVLEKHPDVAKRLSEAALKWRKSLPTSAKAKHD